MASKFRTWTKGDRSISVEWLTARDILSTPDRYNAVPAQKGLPARSSMGKSAATYPPMIPIGNPGEDIGTWHKHSSSEGLQVPQQRSRANTAPSTPRLVSEGGKLVELPGSQPPPTDSTKTPSGPQIDACEAKSRHILAEAASHPSPGSQTGSRPSLQDCVSPLVDSAVSPAAVPNLMAQMLAARLHDTIAPLPCVRSATQLAHLPYPIDEDLSDPAGQNAHTASLSPDASVYSPDELARGDGASVLWQQLANIRHAHEVHLRSLKDAHMKELAGHLSYISFLERRSHGVAVTIPQHAQHGDNAAPVLKIDTSQRFVPLCELPADEVSAVAKSSREGSPQHASLSSLDSASEIESLKRQLSTARREQVEAIQLSLQYRQIKKECKQRHRENQNMLVELKQSQSTMQTMRTTIDNLEAQLVSANNERIDVLEGFHEACAKIITLSQHNADGPARKQSSTTTSASTQTDGDILLGLDDISTTNSRAAASREAHNLTVITTLQDELARKEAVLRQAETDRENFKALLLEEVRRQSRQPHGHKRGLSPSVDMQADVRLQGILADAAFAAGKPGNPASSKETTISDLLEEELESLLRQNIMQKVELKSVRKELKHARADLSALQIITTPRPPTPEDSTHDSAPTTPDTRPRLHTRGSSQGWLNISMAVFPAAAPAQDGTRRLLRPTSSQSLKSMKSPQRRSKTPIGCDKRLPEPPPTEETSVSARVHQCSSSDSIYAFYAGNHQSGGRKEEDAVESESLPLVYDRKQRVTV